MCMKSSGARAEMDTSVAEMDQMGMANREHTVMQSDVAGLYSTSWYRIIDATYIYQLYSNTAIWFRTELWRQSNNSALCLTTQTGPSVTSPISPFLVSFFNQELENVFLSNTPGFSSSRLLQYGY